ncbi:MAG: phospholipase D family protein [Verrucomicrobiota bacterium]|nr:phospholipase D family protein [Verrucomicrobiota bacterium]
MAKFLNTSAANYYLEEIIRLARDRLILISPVLKLNDRVKELLEDKNQRKIEVHLAYEKNDLEPEEINWLRRLSFVRTSFCRNLHAKCYLNEQFGIVSSLNLHELSHAKSNEIGVLVSKDDDEELFQSLADEADRIIRISDEVRMSFEKVRPISEENSPNGAEDQESAGKLSTSRLAKKLGLKTQELTNHLVHLGAIEIHEGRKQITPLGRRLGGELRVSARFGPYFLWPEALPLAQA